MNYNLIDSGNEWTRSVHQAALVFGINEPEWTYLSLKCTMGRPELPSREDDILYGTILDVANNIMDGKVVYV